MLLRKDCFAHKLNSYSIKNTSKKIFERLWSWTPDLWIGLLPYAWLDWDLRSLDNRGRLYSFLIRLWCMAQDTIVLDRMQLFSNAVVLENFARSKGFPTMLVMRWLMLFTTAVSGFNAVAEQCIASKEKAASMTSDTIMNLSLVFETFLYSDLWC